MGSSRRFGRLRSPSSGAAPMIASSKVSVSAATALRRVLKLVSLLKGKSVVSGRGCSALEIAGAAAPLDGICQRFRKGARRDAEVALGLGGCEEHPVFRHAQRVPGDERLAAGEAGEGFGRGVRPGDSPR